MGKTQGPVNVQEVLDTFILIERFRYHEHHNNRFAGAVGKVQRSHRFLRVIEIRYSQLAAEMLVLEAEKQSWFEVMTKGARSGHYHPTAQEQEISNRIQDICTEVALQIETFYTHGKTLLDHVPHAFRAFFGDARSCSLKSHDSFLKSYDRYVAEKQLFIPAGFLELAQSLSDRVIVYRDKMIAHESDADRFLAISGGVEPRIVSQRIDGTMDTFRSTEGLRPLLREIERYVLLFLDVLKTNEDKTILAINPDIAKFTKAKRLADLVYEAPEASGSFPDGRVL
jgi:hypothetical protein